MCAGKVTSLTRLAEQEGNIAKSEASVVQVLGCLKTYITCEYILLQEKQYLSQTKHTDS